MCEDRVRVEEKRNEMRREEKRGGEGLFGCGGLYIDRKKQRKGCKWKCVLRDLLSHVYRFQRKSACESSTPLYMMLPPILLYPFSKSLLSFRYFISCVNYLGNFEWVFLIHFYYGIFRSV
ncbi:hypothetical protein S245_015374 [Arachis hypogaea]